MITTQHTGVVQKPSIREAIILQGVETAPLVELCKSRKILNYAHYWINDRYADAKDNANLEVTKVGDTPTNTAKKTFNYAQIIKDEVKVSFRAQDVAQYSGNELEYQTTKRGKEHIKNLEYALLGLGHTTVFDAPVAMSESTPARMGGFFYFVPTEHKQTFTDTPFTHDILQEIIQPVWRRGGVENGNFRMYLGTILKGKVNQWIKDNPALRVDVKDGYFNPLVTKIATDYGVIDIYLHRLFTGDKLKDKVLCGSFDEATICYLRDTELMEVQTDETADIKRYYTDATLEVTNQDYFACAEGLK